MSTEKPVSSISLPPRQKEGEFYTKEQALQASQRNIARLKSTLPIADVMKMLEEKVEKEGQPGSSLAIMLLALKEPNFYNVREAQKLVNNGRTQYIGRIPQIPRLDVDGIMGRNTLRAIQALADHTLEDRSSPGVTPSISDQPVVGFSTPSAAPAKNIAKKPTAVDLRAAENESPTTPPPALTQPAK